MLPERDDGPELVVRFPKDKFELTIFEQRDKDGASKRFWTFGRDVPEGHTPLVVGGTLEDLDTVKELFALAQNYLPQINARELVPEPELGNSPRWLAVVRFEELKEGGASAEVVKVYPEHEHN